MLSLFCKAGNVRPAQEHTKSRPASKTGRLRRKKTLCYRMSMYSPASALFMLRTAQNLPHMEQVSLWSS